MIKCSEGCYPCCDFCIHAYHEYFEDEEGYLNGFIRGGPIGCIIHKDEKHRRLAERCFHCEDFYCFKQYRKDHGIKADLSMKDFTFLSMKGEEDDVQRDGRN